MIKIINHIKLHTLNSHLFSQLSEEMNTVHTFSFIQRSKMTLKGRSLVRVLELWELLQRFLLEKKSPLAAYFSDTEWAAQLAYLCDIFNLFNKLNLSLQGRKTTVFKSAEKVAAFKCKLEVEKWQMNTGIFDMFQTLAEIFRDWASTLFLPSGAWSTNPAFKRVWPFSSV